MINHKWKKGDYFIYPDGDRGKILANPDEHGMLVLCLDKDYSHILTDDRFIKRLEDKVWKWNPQ